MIKKALAFFSLCISLIYSVTTATFTAPPTQIPGADAGNNVFSCYNDFLDQVVYSWIASNHSNAPYYAIYDCKSSSFTTLPTPITLSNGLGAAMNGVNCCYNTRMNQAFFTWPENSSPAHTCYAVYDFASASFSIPGTRIVTSSVPQFLVNCCYNSQLNQVFLSWKDGTGAGPYDQHPMYAVYDCETETITTASALISSTIQTETAVFCCYNSKWNQVVFSWENTFPNFNPYYAIYDCQTNAFTTSATAISTNILDSNIASCYNSQLNQVVFSWTDNGSGIYDQRPYYAIYDFATAAFTTPASPITANVYAHSAVYCCYNSLANQVIFSWADYNIDTTTGTRNPYYTIYDCTSSTFTTPATISSNLQVFDKVFCTYNNQQNQVFCSWANLSSPYPAYYSIYTMPLPQNIAAERLLDSIKNCNKHYQKRVSQ